MKGFLFELLQAVLIVAIPISAAFLANFLRNKSAQTAAQIDSEKARRYLSEITNAVTTAVTATSQTYVDELKKTGAFTKEAQLEALDKSIDTAMSVISPAAAQFAAEVYGDLEEFLIAKIEEAVRMQKQNPLPPAVSPSKA